MQCIIDSILQGAIKGADARRLFHGRGHCYPGFTFLCVDWFSPVILISLFKEPGADWLADLRQAITSFDELEQIENIVLQHRYRPNSPFESLKGSIQGDYDAQQNGLKFRLNFTANQNVGFFLDMENCRQWLNQQAKGKSVLNLFAYTCAFSVVARHAGATKVVNVDMAKGALNIGRLNHQLNNIDSRPVSYLAHDIFKSWGKIRKYGPYDLIVVDPPSYQLGSFEAKKDYGKIIRKLPDLLTGKGQVLACLNSPELGFGFLRELFAAGGFVEVDHIATPSSFPEQNPDRGLKTLIFERGRS